MYKEESKLGELLDPIADKILVSTALILLVMNQTIKNYEIIIIDNHSKDNTREIINKFKRLPIKYFLINLYLFLLFILFSHSKFLKNAIIFVSIFWSICWYLYILARNNNFKELEMF